MLRAFFQPCTHFFITKQAANYSALRTFVKNLLPNVHHGLYPIYKIKETHQSGLHYLDKFWREFKF